MSVPTPSAGPERADLSAVLRLGWLTALCLVGASFFYPVFESWSFFAPPVAAAAGASLVVAVVCDRFRVPNGLGGVAQLVTFIAVVPGLIALPGASFGLPLPAALTALFDAAAEGPARLLTTPIPARAEQELLIVPVLGTWLGVSFAWLASRRRQHYFALIGPTLVFATGVAFGPFSQRALRITTFVFVLGALGYVLFVQRSTTRRAAVATSFRRRVMALSRPAAALVLIAAFGCLVGPALPFASARERFTLRSAYDPPPFDPTLLPSPLAEFRKYLTPAWRDRVLFEVSGDLPKRIRLATLDAYDGRVWSVGSGDSQAGRFQLVGARMDPAGLNPIVGKERRTTFILKALNEPWLPMAGKGQRLLVDASVRSRLRHSPESDVLAWASGSPEQTAYSLVWIDAPGKELTDLETLQALPPARVDGRWTRLEIDTPEPLTQFGTESVEGAASDTDRALLLRSRLQEGFYSLNTSPGHSYGDLLKLVADPARMIGNEEHYTAAFGVFARAAQLPTRLVVGFVPQQSSATTLRVRGQDIQTWAEVNIVGEGWVRLDVTPPRSRAPQPKAAEDDARVDAPPPQFDPLPQPVDDATGQSAAPKRPAGPDAQKKAGLRGSVVLLVASGATFGPVALFGAVLATMLGLKRRRRRRRRKLADPSLRIAGAWHELLDRLEEDHRPVPSAATIAETARTLAPDDPDVPTIETIARRVDAAAFHPIPADDAEASAVWSDVDLLSRRIRARGTVLRRLRRNLSLRAFNAERSPRRLQKAAIR